MRRKVPITSLRAKVAYENGQASLAVSKLAFTRRRAPSFCVLLRRRRQRLRGIRERVQIVDHVGALAVLLDAGKAHRGARNEGLRIGQELVQIVIGPGAALGLHAGREVEATPALALLVADNAVEVGTDAVRTILLEGVAGGADLCRRLALVDG